MKAIQPTSHGKPKFGLAWVAALNGIVMLCLIAAGLSPYDPQISDVSAILEPPSMHHLMGTDILGRDLLTRTLYGGRISLAVGISVALLSTMIGLSIGVTAGYLGSWSENILMRTTDLFLSLPSLFVVIFLFVVIRDSAVGGVFDSENNLLVIIVALTSISWMMSARVAYISCKSAKTLEFITAARAIGVSDLGIVVRHILPNIIGNLLVIGVLSIGSTIVLETGISFLGFGVHPRTPTWGNLLAAGAGDIGRHWWLALYPAIAMLLTVGLINALGEKLRADSSGSTSNL